LLIIRRRLSLSLRWPDSLHKNSHLNCPTVRTILIWEIRWLCLVQREWDERPFYVFSYTDRRRMFFENDNASKIFSLWEQSRSPPFHIERRTQFNNNDISTTFYSLSWVQPHTGSYTVLVLMMPLIRTLLLSARGWPSPQPVLSILCRQSKIGFELSPEEEEDSSTDWVVDKNKTNNSRWCSCREEEDDFHWGVSISTLHLS